MIAIHQHVLGGIVFVIVLLGGVAVIGRPLSQKLAAVALLITLLLLAGVFAPLFARQVLDGALLTAVLIVVVLWSVWYAVRLSRCSSDWWTRRLAARPAATAGAPPPDAGSVPATAAAQSPFGGGQADASQAEGGRSDA
jgi:hypothetical protein